MSSAAAVRYLPTLLAAPHPRTHGTLQSSALASAHAPSRPGLLALRARMLARGVLSLARTESFTLIGFVVLASVGALALAARMGTEGGARIVVALLLAVVSLVHGGRTDAKFLLLAGRDPRRVFAAEYAALALPAVLVLLATGWPAAAALAGGGSLLFAALPAGGAMRLLRRRSGRALLRLPLPPRAFEWISGVRRYGGGLLLIEAVAVLGSGYPTVPLAAIASLTVWAALTQLDGEPLVLVEALGGTPERFLREKVMRSLSLFAAVCAPPAAVFLLRHAALYPFLGIVLALTALAHAGSVFAKYALYRDGRRAAVAGTFTALVLVGAAAMVPVGIFLVWRLRQAALRNLHAWLP